MLELLKRAVSLPILFAVAAFVYLLGKKASFLEKPASLPSGETILRASRPMTPLRDSIEVEVGLGDNEAERSRWLIAPDRNAPRIEVQIGTNGTAWIDPRSAGFHFSRDDFGKVFRFVGGEVKGGRFDSVRIRTPIRLENVTVRWANWSW
jgi:hypothetical protein